MHYLKDIFFLKFGAFSRRVSKRLAESNEFLLRGYSPVSYLVIYSSSNILINVLKKYLCLLKIKSKQYYASVALLWGPLSRYDKVKSDLKAFNLPSKKSNMWDDVYRVGCGPGFSTVYFLTALFIISQYAQWETCDSVFGVCKKKSTFQPECRST